MALSINDVIALANAGFSKTDIAAFMNLGNPQTTPPSPVQVPGATAPTVPTAPATVPTPAPAQQAPATPDLGQLVASLAAEKGILVSVLSADTRDLSGQCYGSMLLKLPADVEQAKQAAAYMRSQPGVTVEEVTGE